MRTLALWCIALAACSESIEGEDVGPGTITLHYGSSTPDLIVGSAVESDSDPGEMIVQLGTNHVGCNTNLDSGFGEEGTYVYFSVPKMPGTYANTYTQIAKIEPRSYHGNGTTSGMVTIDTVDARVTGSLTVSTTDDDVGTISADGTFDVIRCF